MQSALKQLQIRSVQHHELSDKCCLFGWPFVKRFALCYQTVVCPVLSVCNVGVLWPSGWVDQDETLHACTPRPWPHCARWRLSSPPQKGGGAPSPIFRPFLLWTSGWMHQDATWYGGRPRLSDIVLDGDPAPSPKKGQIPLINFRPMSIVAKRLDGSRWHLAWRWALVRPHCARWGPSAA